MTNAEGSKTLVFKLTVTDNEGVTAEDTVTITVKAVNGMPTANAGEDQEVNENAFVSLYGKSDGLSEFLDGDTLTYSWLQTDSSGVVAALSGADSFSPWFTAPAVDADTTLTFTLTVDDGYGGTDTDTVNILVKNKPNVPPTANAGTDQTVNEKLTVNLNGSGADSDGSIASYAWTQTAGDNATLTGTNTATPSFTAPTVSNADGSKTLTFKLVVTDNQGATGEDSVSITVNAVNENPAADAGANQAVNENASVSLGGSATDPDGDTPTYSWVQTDSSGLSVTLTGANTATPSFTAPAVNADTTLTFTLTVSDGYGGTATDTMDVLVKNIPVVQPTGTGKLNDTGITLCGDYAYDGSGNHNNNVVCSLLTDVEGDPVPPGQDATAGRDASQLTDNDADGHRGFSFTKISSSGAELPADATQWSCVKDNVTGLIWEVKTDDGGLRDKDNAYTWYEPDNSKNGGNPGYSGDWQLYTMTLEPGSYTLNFKYTKDGSVSTGSDAVYIDHVKVESAGTGQQLSLYDFEDGQLPSGWQQTAGADAGWVVSDTAQQGVKGLQSDDIADNQTASMDWNVTFDQQVVISFYYNASTEGCCDFLRFSVNATERLDYAGAPATGCGLPFCNTNAFVGSVNTSNAGAGICGANDWRMPTKEELRSIVSYDRYYPAIDTTWFPNTPSAWFWSASPVAFNGSSAWLVDFFYGYDYDGYKGGVGSVRLVRSGQ